MALGALECRGEDSILRSTVSIARGFFSLLFSQDHAPWHESQLLTKCCFVTLEGVSVRQSEKPLLCVATHIRVGVGTKPGVFLWRHHVTYPAPSLSLLSHCRGRGVCFSTRQKPPYSSALGDLVSSQIIFGPRGRWTHCTFSGVLIISILETVIYETLAFFRRVFPPSKAKNIVIVCDVLKTLVTSWSQMLINVKCFFEELINRTHMALPISFKFW